MRVLVASWAVLSLTASSSCLSLSSDPTNRNHKGPQPLLRVNRALRATHSRRQVNTLISQGRLSVNYEVVSNPDDRLQPGDVVTLDGTVAPWEESDLPRHRYIKFHKPRGVVCTTDRRVEGNILDALESAEILSNVSDSTAWNDTACVNVTVNTTVQNQSQSHSMSNASTSNRRVYPIGRLDADSVGLILLTSDGSIVNPLLRSDESKTKTKSSKEYHVRTSPRASDDDILELARGVVITAPARRGGLQGVPVTARTLPCVVERMELMENDGEDDAPPLRFVLSEGRNRQIRKMCAQLGLEVIHLHREVFATITLQGCEEPGSWVDMTDAELVRIGAKKGPTREERRSPEERARRKLKKLSKKRKKRFG